MDKKNILVITELFLPTKGGSAIWFYEVYRRLGGKNIHIITADVSGAKGFDITQVNSIHRVNLKRLNWLRPESLVMYLKLLLQAIKVCIKYNIDTIHAGRVLPEGLVALVVGRLFTKHVVIYAHGEEITTWRQPGKFKVMCFTYRHAGKVIANSEFTKNELLKLKVERNKITLISPGVDIERFKPGLPFANLHQQINFKKDQQLLLSVGRLSRRKGFDQVIKSLPILIKAGIDVQYAIIGIGEDKEYLLELVKQNNLVNNVHFLGHVAMDDLPRWYNACDVFVMPNREINGDTEGFGMVFLEAAACGKPAISGVAGGTGSAIIHGETGLRVEGSSLASVTEGLKSLLSDLNYQNTLGKNALQRARDKFSWDRVSQLTERGAV